MRFASSATPWWKQWFGPFLELPSMHQSAFLGIAILVCCTLLARVTTAQEKPRGTLEQDRQKLEGLWRTEGWRKEGADGWQCHAAVSLLGSKSPRLSLTINLERESKSGSGPVLGSQVQLKEKDGKRSLAL